MYVLKKEELVKVIKILVIIPAYNEENSIKNVILNLQSTFPSADYLIINDCSKDSTKQLCLSNHFSLVSLPINLGIGGGVQTGYKYALENDYDIAVQMDGDGQHDPAYIKDIVQPIEQGEADIVIGSRFLEKEGFQSSSARRFGINFLSRLVYLCCGTRVKDVTSGFRAVNKEYIKFYADSYPQDYPEPEAIVAAARNGARIREVPVVMKERQAGKSYIGGLTSITYMLRTCLSILLIHWFR